MFVLDFKLSSVDSGEEASCNLVVEERRGNIWNRKSSQGLSSSTPDSQRKIVVGDNERVVVEPIVVEDLVYDHEQKAARPMTDAEREQKKQEQYTASPSLPASDNAHPTAALGNTDAPQNSPLPAKSGSSKEDYEKSRQVAKKQAEDDKKAEQEQKKADESPQPGQTPQPPRPTATAARTSEATKPTAFTPTSPKSEESKK